MLIRLFGHSAIRYESRISNVGSTIQCEVKRRFRAVSAVGESAGSTPARVCCLHYEPGTSAAGRTASASRRMVLDGVVRYSVGADNR